MTTTAETFDDYQFVTSGIQLAVNDFYDSHKYVSDEAVDQIIDTFWEDIPLDMDTITIDHPSIQGAFIIVELNPDYDEDSEEDDDNYPYSVHRVYASIDDEDQDDNQIESGLTREAQLLSVVRMLSARSLSTACY